MPRALIVGAGHNGLVCAAYLARAGFAVQVLERRAVLGGACSSEALWEGCTVSRAAYVLSLLRPEIVLELELRKRGLELIPRQPSSLTPLPDGRALVLGQGAKADCDAIAYFSAADARAYPRYEAWLGRVAAALEPLLDRTPAALPPRGWRDLRELGPLLRAGYALRGELTESVELLLGSAAQVLSRWFESEPLRATLATDAVIGAFAPPSQAGTGYLLFHHVMGSLGGARGVWAYVRGGMGRLAGALADAARAAGARVRTDAPVAQIRTQGGSAVAVVLESGEEIAADLIVSNADPRRTFALLDDARLLAPELRRSLDALDFRSPVVKLNLLLGELPRFRGEERAPLPKGGTIHVGALSLAALERAFSDAQAGVVSEAPMVELTIPSALDDSLAPAGRYVASIFAQYAPALAPDDARWGELRSAMQTRVLAQIDEVAPGFSSRIERSEVLAAPDLEAEFALTGGNIFHGAMTTDRLHLLRPLPGLARYRTPVAGLWLCGAGTHPGGGVMGAPGRNAAREILRSHPRR